MDYLIRASLLTTKDFHVLLVYQVNVVKGVHCDYLSVSLIIEMLDLCVQDSLRLSHLVFTYFRRSVRCADERFASEVRTIGSCIGCSWFARVRVLPTNSSETMNRSPLLLAFPLQFLDALPRFLQLLAQFGCCI